MVVERGSLGCDFCTWVWLNYWQVAEKRERAREITLNLSPPSKLLIIFTCQTTTFFKYNFCFCICIIVLICFTHEFDLSGINILRQFMFSIPFLPQLPTQQARVKLYITHLQSLPNLRMDVTGLI